MNFINNYRASITLPLAATSLALALPNGSYRLTITDSDSSPTRWEIVDAVVVGGTATLTRAREATAAQDWPAGSVIYCPLTAGLLTSLFSQLAAAQTAIAGLTARVLALENSVPSPGGALTDETGNRLVDHLGNQLIEA
jgi:hypothetical protein